MQITGPISALLKAKPPAIWSIGPEATVFDAITLMSEKNIGALLVMEGDRLLGIFTERDYTRKLILRGRSSRDTKIADVATVDVLAVDPSSSVEEAMRRMTRDRVRHLPVVENGNVIGVVSIGDLVKWTISAQTATIDHLESYIAGEYPR
jgi:CBS domain-containing protein